MKNFLSVHDVPDINALVQQALRYKQEPRADQGLGRGLRIGCIFLNPSLRTRLSTQVAARNLGMEAVVFNAGSEGWSLEFEEGAVMNGTSVEHIKDAAPVLGQYFDVLALRTFPGLQDQKEDYSETYLKQFVRYAGVPVISLESATLHPLQSLADTITIREQLEATPLPEGRRPKVVLSWAPHIKPLPQCVANSFAQWMTAWKEVDLVIAQPEGYELDGQFTEGATHTTNQEEALEGADFVYVKNWSSYKHYGQILGSSDPSWMLTLDKLKATNGAKVMHCLPVRRNLELSDEVLDSAHSLVTRQAGNRVWAAQSVLANILQSRTT